ncbi:Modulator of FtsH protease HflC [Piscirickettsia salmonis]|uniref:Protein HflC n=1 Tax=Piscirickettsia salmonis TaxID=1238 RepID=A0A1L6TBD3_PISSA|nr:protease modulator HflC [Piscirickettsia salmonis]AKP73771.2 hflC protein [Piscirickettsia salmonis LF-89 = ATCC VR-1361]ALB22561.1 HflC [Piscirickettsia salmonis]ALY02583.1 hflC protein [Piscirickettsia salmonis]AMA42125.1 hflC protein [Piscirickettsia salmonis]AOS34601.1 hflC protein [Piscirickettsia salmonis]
MQKSMMGLATLIIIGGLAYSSMYTVEQGSRALLVRLGKVEQKDGKVALKMPGLHFKWPGVEGVLTFNARIQNLSIDASRIVTKEKKDVIVDSFVKWKIDSFERYYTATGGDALRAQVLISQQVNDGLRAEFGNASIQELLAGGKRDQVMKDIRDTVESKLTNYGIYVVDVRIKQINLPTEVADSVFARMRAEREQEASKIRAEGQEQAEIVRARADARKIEILARSELNAQKFRAAGDKQAASIYTKAYSVAPEFYSFYRSLEAYKNSFESANNKDSVFVLQPNSEFFKYFNSTGKG